MTKRKGPRIIAIGGGKGGVGKTTVAANLALMIGRVGFRVVLVDVDLGAANLHTTLNFLRPRHTLADYLDHKTDDLGSLAVDITSTVRLVAGTSRPGAANLLATERLRLLRGIASIDADVIIVDVGAGTSYTVVDTFAAADHKLLVISPQLTSVHNAYAMLKACVHRVLRRHLTDDTQLDLLDAALGQESKARTVAQLLDVIRPLGEQVVAPITATLMSFGVGLIGNQIATPADEMALRRITPLLRDNFALDAPFVAAIPRTPSLAGSLKAGVGSIAMLPNDEATRTFRRLADTLMGSQTERRDSKTVPLWISRGLEAEAARGQS
jgi:flagellar biosynthesis protein FlhG